jgi:hypothetical protein
MATSLAIVAQKTGAVVLPDTDKVWTHRLQVAGSTGNAYTVAMRRTDQTWGCSCRGWIGHRKCKHLSAMLPVLTASFPGSKAATPILKIKG